MPIKAENRSLYPGGSPNSREWRAIREEVLKRAGNHCEKCGVYNHEWIARAKSPRPMFRYVEENPIPELGWTKPPSPWQCAETGEILDIKPDCFPYPVRVVLTIAHLDHDPTNNGDPGNRPNLKALCQRCHNRHDAAHRAQTRKGGKK